MDLRQKLMADLGEAMKARDDIRRSTLRMVVAGITNAEKAKGTPLSEGDILDVIARDVKRHKESIAEFEKGNRDDLVAREQAELAILMQYLPSQMSREEIEAAARQVISEVGAYGSGDNGKVMSKLMPLLKGKADGRTINEVVSELLSGT